jgi:hypothetical protein
MRGRVEREIDARLEPPTQRLRGEARVEGFGGRRRGHAAVRKTDLIVARAAQRDEPPLADFPSRLSRRA